MRRLRAAFGLLALILGVLVGSSSGVARTPHVWRVGSWHGIAGQFQSIQKAVDVAQPGDWILVGPGDYHEKGKTTPVNAGVVITTPGIWLRGMDRNQVIVDGTRGGAPPCSSNAADQAALGRNGIEVWKANDTWVENLTVCNWLTDANGAEGNEIWWNGGDGSGKIGLDGYWGDYLTATSTYSNWVNYPAGNYGIFSSNSTNGWFKHSYASNMADSAFYVGACQQVCNFVMDRDIGQFSSLCLSSTNAGGYLLVENTECSLNKTGLVSNSQNNDDRPSPQIGLCPPGKTGPTGTQSCTVWMNNWLHDNNNPNVPGNGTSGLAGAGPVGTGLILAGSEYVTLAGNLVENNGAWGELIADLPDPESGPSNCQGGTWISAGTICLYQAFGNVSLSNTFKHNGFFNNPTNGDVGLATNLHNPGNCFAKDSVPDGTDPPGIETNPAYAAAGGMCTTPNAGDYGPLAAQAECATQLLAPCPSAPGASYPRPSPSFALTMPPAALTPSMPDPCSGVPANPWCP